MSSLPLEYDVLVAGAGPAGSVSATLLARAGFSVVLVDRASFPRDKACSEYMSPEAVRILARLGVVESLEISGAFPLEGMKLFGPRGATAHGKFAGAGNPFRSTGLSVSRRILDHELLATARQAGATVLLAQNITQTGTRFGSFHPGICQFLFGDSSVRPLRTTTAGSILERLAARSDGNPVSGF